LRAMSNIVFCSHFDRSRVHQDELLNHLLLCNS
jgi:hypothetical protein